MTATVPFIQQTFDRFNALCFEGALPAVTVVLSRARTFLGKMEYKVRRDFFGNIVSCYDYRLKISTAFDLAEDELEDVVIHEMIHCYIAFRNIRDTSVHGEAFRRIMNAINTHYGRHISVRHKGSPERDGGNDARRAARPRCVCVSTFRDGKVGVTVCSSAKVRELSRQLPRYYHLESMGWYVSNDPFFARYPLSRTPKIYRASAGDLEEHLKGAEGFEDGWLL